MNEIEQIAATKINIERVNETTWFGFFLRAVFGVRVYQNKYLTLALSVHSKST